MSDIKKQTEELVERISSEETKDPFKRLSEIAFKSYGAPRYAERLVEESPIEMDTMPATMETPRPVGFENIEPPTPPTPPPEPAPTPTQAMAAGSPPPEPLPADIPSPGNRDDGVAEAPYSDEFGVGKRDTLESEMRADAMRAANPGGPYANLAGQARALAEARAGTGTPHNIHSEAEAQQARNIRNMTAQQSEQPEQTLEERITAELLAMLGEGSGDRNDDDREQGHGNQRQRTGSDGKKGELEEGDRHPAATDDVKSPETPGGYHSTGLQNVDVRDVAKGVSKDFEGRPKIEKVPSVIDVMGKGVEAVESGVETAKDVVPAAGRTALKMAVNPVGAAQTAAKYYKGKLGIEERRRTEDRLQGHPNAPNRKKVSEAEIAAALDRILAESPTEPGLPAVRTTDQSLEGGMNVPPALQGRGGMEHPMGPGPGYQGILQIAVDAAKKALLQGDLSGYGIGDPKPAEPMQEGSGDRNDDDREQGHGNQRQRAGSDGKKGELEEGNDTLPDVVGDVHLAGYDPAKTPLGQKMAGSEKSSVPGPTAAGTDRPALPSLKDLDPTKTSLGQGIKKGAQAYAGLGRKVGGAMRQGAKNLGQGLAKEPIKVPSGAGAGLFEHEETQEVSDKEWYDTQLYESLLRKWTK